MTVSLKESEPLESGLRRLAIDGIEVALAVLDGPEGRDVAVHTVRKQCKQVRALLRLYGPALGAKRKRESRLFRDLGRSLAQARDSKVALDVHAALIERYESVLVASVGAELRQALIGWQQTIGSDQRGLVELYPDTDSLRQSLAVARTRARRWTLGSDRSDVLECGIGKAYRHARKAIRRAADTHAADDLHEARKRSKDLWYQLEFVSRRWPELALERTAPVRRLTELLGDSQDLVTYTAAIRMAAGARNPQAVDVLTALADQRRVGLESAALVLGEQIFADKPTAFASRLARPLNSHYVAH